MGELREGQTGTGHTALGTGQRLSGHRGAKERGSVAALCLPRRPAPGGGVRPADLREWGGLTSHSPGSCPSSPSNTPSSKEPRAAEHAVGAPGSSWFSENDVRHRAGWDTTQTRDRVRGRSRSSVTAERSDPPHGNGSVWSYSRRGFLTASSRPSALPGCWCLLPPEQRSGAHGQPRRGLPATGVPHADTPWGRPARDATTALL